MNTASAAHTPITLTSSVALAPDGCGYAKVSAPNDADLVITEQTIATETAAAKPGARVYGFIEGSNDGNDDHSDTRIVVPAGTSLICVWEGGDPGTTATYEVRGMSYPPGQAPEE